MWCIYITREPATGRFYLGKTSVAKHNKGYVGSGKWVKHALAKDRLLESQILIVSDDESEAYDLERVFVEIALGYAGSMNMVDGGRGLTSEAVKKIWDRPGYRERQKARKRAMSESDRDAHRARMRAKYSDPAVRKALSDQLKAFYADPEILAKHSARMAAQCSTQKAKEFRSVMARTRYADHAARDAQRARMATFYAANPQARAEHSALKKAWYKTPAGFAFIEALKARHRKRKELKA
jgi:hypothetical protein